MIKFTIPLPPISKKNHQQIYINKATGRPFITQSAAYKQYANDCGIFLRQYNFLHLMKPIDYPVNVKAIYYMPTHRKVDLCNLHAALHDILVTYDILDDDNSEIIVSTDGSKVDYDKVNPRTEVVLEAI